MQEEQVVATCSVRCSSLVGWCEGSGGVCLHLDMWEDHDCHPSPPGQQKCPGDAADPFLLLLQNLFLTEVDAGELSVALC
jgi:hypothetical protein